MSKHNGVQAVYDRLWQEGADRLSRGHVEIDRYLRQPQADRRRGTTLILRPSATVLDRLQAAIDELRAAEPDQYFYPRADLHVTLLTLERATSAFAPQAVPVETYHRLFTGLFAKTRPFSIHLEGLCATAEAVLAQGYVPGDDLNALRDALRRGLAGVGLADGLDVRYRIVSAHVTLARFKAPLREPTGFLSRLTAARRRDFGVCTIDRVEFVVNDWYMSNANLQVLTEYRLGT